VVTRWHGPDRKGVQTYGPAFHAAWSNQPGAGKALAAVAANSRNPGFARAGALTELNAYLSPETARTARTALKDSDPMVRIGALDSMEGIPVQQLWPIASPALSDPVRGVRIRAASLLAGMPISALPPQDRASFNKASQEFIAAQRLNADRPEGRTTLGNFFARRGQAADAEAEFRAALRLNNKYVPAAVNLADLYAQQQQGAKAETVLRDAIETSPRDASLHHALGLALVRAKRPVEALDELRLASELQPERARYSYVYGVALHSTGRQAEAIKELERTAQRHSADRETLAALVNYNRERGDLTGALKYAERLAKSFPEDHAVEQIVRDLREQSAR
jgi:tetratricopeptide (TPR) repeat protein